MYVHRRLESDPLKVGTLGDAEFNVDHDLPLKAVPYLMQEKLLAIFE